MTDPLVAAAVELTDEVLFPAAGSIDRSEAVPAEIFDAIADAGLYGVAGPGVDPRVGWLVTEILASGSMAAAFVWIQHHTAVRDLSQSDNAHLVEAWLADVLAGRRRCGIAIGGAVGPEPSLRASRSGDHWILDGTVPWVTGWGLVDAFDVVAVTDGGQEIRVLVDDLHVPSVKVERQRLVAADASSTVRMTLTGHRVPVLRTMSARQRPPFDPHDGGGRGNGSLALGVVRRACVLMGPTAIDDELGEVRARLDRAGDADMAEARAAASELAIRAAARLVVHTGSAAVSVGSHAERLNREALFTAVFGSRKAIKHHLSSLLSG